MKFDKVFSNPGSKTHMPFFDGQTLMFCTAKGTVKRTVKSGGSIWKTMERKPELKKKLAKLPRENTVSYRAWKLAYCDWQSRKIRSIDTGLPKRSVECSPAFYQDDAGYHVSFIGCVREDDSSDNRLYKMTGPSLDKLSPAEPVDTKQTLVGFVSPTHTCTGRSDTLTLTPHDGTLPIRLTCPRFHILRATFLPDNNQHILISGLDDIGVDTTLLYKLDTDEQFEVSAGGPVYKSCLHGDRIIFAHRLRGESEDRELRHGKFELLKPGIKAIRTR